MKTKRTLFALSIIALSLLTSCATIIGGSKYYARIVVDNNPNAKITYKGEVVGSGSARVKVNRIDANKFEFKVKQDGFEEQTFKYTTRSFRGWAFVGTVLGWTGLYNGIPLPWGVAVDFATGAVWKPNVMEKGVSKDDFKNFRYLVNYGDSKAQQIYDFLYLKNGSVIKGQIVEQVIGSTVKIQTLDGSQFVYKIEDIEKITRE
jgi:hypothetical protein